MNSSPIQAILGAGTAVAAAVTVATSGSAAALGLASMAALAVVAVATQSARLRDEQRLVYRPVYVRRHDVQRRVRSDD